MQNRNNFNNVAPIYDWFCTLIFGQKVKQAQIDSIQFIPPDSTILIAGGGTGWILEEISKIFPSGLSITYLDKSSKMIELSKKRNTGLNRVEFINASIEDVHLSHQKYDVIITPFFLDCFSQTAFQSIFQKLNDSLKKSGLWLNTDFYLSDRSALWQKILVKIMYLFFHISCHIEASRLPTIHDSFSGYTLISRKMYCNNFINQEVFRKKP